MADRDKALEDYKAGLSYKEIAEKHCIDFVAIRASKRIYKYPRVAVYHKNLFE